MHKTSLIKLEPDVLQVDLRNDSLQHVSITLKVTNTSGTPLPGLFFCLYNQQKFDISPENFSLQPNQSKIVSIRVKLLEQERRNSHKQYAYLKSSVISRRITILLNGDQQQSQSDIIISSRVTKNPREQSLNSGPYIHRNFQIQQGTGQFGVIQQSRVDQSRFTTANFEQDLENFDNETRTVELYKQLSIAESQSVDLKRRLRLSENDKETFKREVQSLKRDSERQYNKDINYKTLYEKEKTIYSQLKEELEKLYGDRNTIDMRRRDAQAQLHNRDIQIKHLEHENSHLKDKLIDAEEQVADLKSRNTRSSKEMIIREEQLRHIRGELEMLKQAIDSFETERVQHIKIELDNNKLAESNQSLQQQIEKLQAMLSQQQQQLLKVEAVKQHTESTKESTDKTREYLSLALESSKMESQTLKMSKQDLEKTLAQLALNEKQLTAKLRTAELQVEDLQQENLSINEDLLRLNNQNTQLHNQAMELQTVKTDFSILKRQLVSAEHKFLTLQRETQSLLKEKEQNNHKLKSLEVQQEKYRIDVTRQLDSIKKSTTTEAIKLSNTKAKRRKHKQKQLEHDTANKDNERTQLKQIENPFQKNKGELVNFHEQPSISSRGRIRSRSINHCEENTTKTLESLQEAMKMFDTEHSKICKQLQLHEDVELDSPCMKVLSFFRQLECKVSEIIRIHKEQSEYLNEIRRLKLQLIDKEIALKVKINPANQSEQEESAKPSDKSCKLIEFIQEEMRTQFSKMQTALSFSNEKFEVLRRKLYNQYHSRIVNLLSAKQKTALPRLEMLLQRFIDGMANQTHKQALLNRHSKKQAEAAKQHKMLKHRIHELEWLLGEKQTAVCTRSPVQVVYNNSATGENIFQSLKFESQLLSCKAELSQVTEELAFTMDNLNNVNQELANTVQSISKKDQDISRLRMQLFEVERLHKSELVDALEEMDSMRMYSMKVGELEQQLALQIEKSKSTIGLKDQLSKKKELIKGLKDREKSLVQIIEDIRAHIQDQQKQKSDKGRSKEEIRLQQIIANLKQCNKELKAQLQKRTQSKKNLTDQIERKNGQISSLRATVSLKEQQLKNFQNQEQSQAKAQKKKMECEIREAKATASKLQNQLENARKRLDQLEAEVAVEKQQGNKLSDEATLKQKSMMCTIRSLADILRTIWRSIEVKVRKIRPSGNYNLINYESIAGDPMKIDVLKLYNSFAEMISVIKESPSTGQGFTV